MSAKIEILSEGKTVIQPEDLYRVSSLRARARTWAAHARTRAGQHISNSHDLTK